MAVPAPVKPAKLFVGIIYADDSICKRVQNLLTRDFGPVDTLSNPIPFTHTAYYDRIGDSLFKVFFAFERLMQREEISSIKLHTNFLETYVSGEGEKRKVNIDPGYLTLSNVFLATCKDYYHRAYIGNGIFIENEYYFRDGSYRFWEWTYPDYRKKAYLNFFHEARRKYRLALRQ